MDNTIQKTRRGFTLLELLIVIVLISFLAVLTTATLASLTDQANEEATNTTIEKVNRLLEQRINAFDRSFRSIEGQRAQEFRNFVASVIATDPGVSLSVAQVRQILERVSQDDPVWNILGRKAAYRFAFPQRMTFSTSVTTLQGWDLMPDANGATGQGGFNDLFRSDGSAGSDGIPDNIVNRMLRDVSRQTYRDSNNGTAPNAAQLATEIDSNWAIHLAHEEAAVNDPNLHSTESAELLYFMVFKSGTFGSSTAGEDRFRGTEIADTDGDGMLEFVDAWGNPLRFYRWPTRLIDPKLALNAFTPGNLPDIQDQNDETDLLMRVSQQTDNDPPTVQTIGSRIVDDEERAVADVLIRGLPRRIDFSPTFQNALAARLDNPTIPNESHVIIAPEQLLRDPDDPAGLLYSLLENGLQIGSTSIDISNVFNERQYHTPDTFHAPMILSCGVDELLGLREPSDTNQLGHVAMYEFALGADLIGQISDNLTSRNRRAGARR